MKITKLNIEFKQNSNIDEMIQQNIIGYFFNYDLFNFNL